RESTRTFFGSGRGGISPRQRRSVARVLARSPSCQRFRSVGIGHSGILRVRNDSGTSAHGSPCFSPPFASLGVTRSWAVSGQGSAKGTITRAAGIRNERDMEGPPQGDKVSC